MKRWARSRHEDAEHQKPSDDEDDEADAEPPRVTRSHQSATAGARKAVTRKDIEKSIWRKGWPPRGASSKVPTNGKRPWWAKAKVGDRAGGDDVW